MLRIEIINQKDKHTEIQYIVEKRPREIMNFESPKYIFYKFINGNVAFHTWILLESEVGQTHLTF